MIPYVALCIGIGVLTSCAYVAGYHASDRAHARERSAAVQRWQAAQGQCSGPRVAVDVGPTVAERWEMT